MKRLYVIFAYMPYEFNELVLITDNKRLWDKMRLNCVNESYDFIFEEIEQDKWNCNWLNTPDWFLESLKEA